MENVYKVVKIYKKEPTQDWSGLYINVATALNSTPDPRDSNTIPETDKQILKELSDEIKSWPGYLGWDREYLTDDMMALTRYFDDGKNAKDFLIKFTKQSEAQPKVEQNDVIGKYTTKWLMITPDGTVQEK